MDDEKNCNVTQGDSPHTWALSPKDLATKLATLTDGLLNIQRVDVDEANEVLGLQLDNRVVRVSTDSSEEGFHACTDYPEGALVEAMSKVLHEVGSEKVFCTLFGSSGRTILELR